MTWFFAWMALTSTTFTQMPTTTEALERLKSQVAVQGGFEEIEKNLAPLRQDFAARLESEQQGRRIKRGMHRFNRNISKSAIKPDWQYKPEPEKHQFLPAAVVIDFHQKLAAMGIPLIFVPVPSKIEAYPEVFETSFPKGGIASPGRMRTMMKLLEAGVQVVDVLPTILAAKEKAEIPVYETSGHHLSGLGARLAGNLVSEHLQGLDLKGRDPHRFKAVERMGTERVDRSVPMKTWEVRYADDSSYEHQYDAQIAIIGDSNAFAFRKASWASHIARATGVAVADHSTSSGGAFAHLQLAELGLASLQRLKAVVWIVTSSQMERFGWPMGELPKQATIRGLAAAGRIDEAFAQFEAYQKQGHSEPPWRESDMNRQGYALFFAFKQEAALAVFQLNTKAFPNSANAFDSLGEAYKMQGKIDEARRAFLKGMSLSDSDRMRETLVKNLADMGFDPQGNALPSGPKLAPWPAESADLALWVKTLGRGVNAKLAGAQDTLFNYDFQPKGFAWLDDQGRMRLKHGRFLAPNTQDLLKRAFSGDFTLETFADITDTGSGTLWEFGRDGKGGIYRLATFQNTLIFSLKTRRGEVDLLSGKWDSGRAFHCAVTRRGDRFQLWINGKSVATAEEKPLPIAQGRYQLQFGNGTSKQAGLDAALEGIALHRRALPPEIMKELAASYLGQTAKRNQQPQLVLKGRLLRKSEPANIEELAPYNRSLSVYEYEVLSVSKGSYEHKTIRVAHWTLMDGVVHPHRFLNPGDEVALRVKVYEANRHLRNTHLSDTLPIDLDGQLFYQTY